MRFCPGLYCGRVWLENGSLSDCGACPRGSRAHKSICEPCRQDLELYDWIYLSFMVVIYVLIQLFFIDKSTRFNRFNFVTFAMYMAILGETILAATLSLLVFNSPTEDGYWMPFSLKTCGVKSFSDWYTLFYNPTINDTFHCTHEAVYPLYSIVLLFYLISLALVMTRTFYSRLVSCVVYLLTKPSQVKKLQSRDYLRIYTRNIYYVLYSIPALIFIHAMFAGIIYYIFPYLLIIGSVISIAIHLSYHIDQSYRYLFHATFQFRNLIIVLGHWALHGFGIIALTELKHHHHYLLLLLVPFPTLFYIFTAKFSDPAKL